MSESIPQVSDSESKLLRATYSEIVISTGFQNSAGSLHFPEEKTSDSTAILCSTDTKRQDEDGSPQNTKRWLRKSIACYPPGFKPFCKECVSKWRHSKVFEGSEQAAEEFLNRVGGSDE